MTGFDRDSFVNVDKNKVHRFIGPVSGNMIPFRARKFCFKEEGQEIFGVSQNFKRIPYRS